jgi:hypothetical protein
MIWTLSCGHRDNAAQLQNRAQIIPVSIPARAAFEPPFLRAFPLSTHDETVSNHQPEGES